MSAPRFYLDQPLAPGARFSLPPGPARHAARALRLAVDDAVTLFNGRGGEYAARIERIHKDEVAVSITGFVDIECESRLRVVLAQGISSGERMDYTLQKAVELGVAAIQPIAAKRSVVKLAGERADKRDCALAGRGGQRLRTMWAQSGTSGGCTAAAGQLDWPTSGWTAALPVAASRGAAGRPARPDCHGLPGGRTRRRIRARRNRRPACSRCHPGPSGAPRAAHRDCGAGRAGCDADPVG